MGGPVAIQHSFHAGEFAPALLMRTDLAKYRSAAALMRNFYVDYRGGASSRMGTKYCLQAYKSATAVRLIPFSASFAVNYVLEFGDLYIRFYFNGTPILEATKAITAITQASPGVITSVAHGYSTGDWVFLTGIVGMTQLNGRYVQVNVVDADHYSVQRILDLSAINTGTYSAYVSGGTSARVYTLPSPFASSSDLSLIKVAQNVNTMVLCHPSYDPQILTLTSANNWTITPISFGANIPAPTGLGIATTLAAGTVNYSYEVTSIDANGQESQASTPVTLANIVDQTTNPGSIVVSWTPVSGAQYYNVYKAIRRYGAPVPSGASHGFIGFTFGASFVDTNIAADFSLTPPIAQNPFVGGKVTSYTVTSPGTYVTVPTVTVAAPPTGTAQATATAVLGARGTPAVTTSSNNWNVGDIAISAQGVALVVATVNGFGAVLTVQVIGYPGSNPGAVASGAVPANPVLFNDANHIGFTFRANLTWGVTNVVAVQTGAAYDPASPPAVTFSAGTATATANVTASSGRPTVPAYFNQRLVLAGLLGSPGEMDFSRPGSFFNYDRSNPIQPDDSIQATLSSLTLNTIKSMIPMPSGLVTLTDRQAWLVNGGGGAVAIDPANATANSQAYNGAGDLQPIVGNYDILYVQSKGSIVRDLAFNFYTQIYTGTDISVLSSHLFYGFTINSWAFAEEPFKVVWAVRNDGVCLSLTFLKEQDLVGWAHHDTNGLFKSNCVVTEIGTPAGNVDAAYFVVQRTINGNTVQYIERMAERIFPNGVVDAWCVDAGLQYSGAPATNFSGAEHLANTTLTGLADGQIISVTPSIDGTFSLGVAASKVTVGLGFTCQLQSVRLDAGEPTIQSKRKNIGGTTARVVETLGLYVGSEDLTQLVPMKDLIRGNLGTMTNQLVTDLVTGDARTVTDPLWDTFGQIFFQQTDPMPATILGIMPEPVIGDTAK